MLLRWLALAALGASAKQQRKSGGHDYYALLKIKPSCTAKELKKAYHEAAKKYHPDKNPGDEAAAKKFALVATAYAVLSDPAQKRIYDQLGEEGLKRGGRADGRAGVQAGGREWAYLIKIRPRY